jgi:aspartyl-tRNA(Asn)/glutamyl-tRNA(Gln) amidotransferase subunit C
MVLSKEEVQHIAKLGRLALTDEEVNQYSKDLNQILSYVDLLQELDTKNVEPMVGAVELSNITREDQKQTSGKALREAMLANAASTEATFIKVPKMGAD